MQYWYSTEGVSCLWGGEGATAGEGRRRRGGGGTHLWRGRPAATWSHSGRGCLWELTNLEYFVLCLLLLYEDCAMYIVSIYLTNWVALVTTTVLLSIDTAFLLYVDPYYVYLSWVIPSHSTACKFTPMWSNTRNPVKSVPQCKGSCIDP